MKENLTNQYINVKNIEITKSDDWKNSIDIKIKSINYRVEYNLDLATNLFIIIKSYTKNIKYIPKSINVRILQSVLDVNLVTFRENSRFFEKFNFEEFIEWWNYRINNDNKYIGEDSFYSITIVYSDKIIKLEKQMIYPIYPWSEKILEELKTLENKEDYYKKLIDFKNKEIEEKEKTIKEKNNEIENLKKLNLKQIWSKFFKK